MGDEIEIERAPDDVEDRELARLDIRLEIPAKAGRLVDQLFGILLEGDVETALAILQPLDDESQRKSRFSTTRRSQDERRTSNWKSTSGHLVNAWHAGGNSAFGLRHGLERLIDGFGAHEQFDSGRADGDGVLAGQMLGGAQLADTKPPSVHRLVSFIDQFEDAIR